MPISPQLNAEIRVLTLFNLDSAMEGIKIHQSADAETQQKNQRLRMRCQEVLRDLRGLILSSD